MSTLIRLIGRGLVVVAGMAFLTGAALLVLGSFLMTWPILRLAPRDRRLKAGLDVVSAMLSAGIAMAPKPQPPREDD